jgi:hypothetical protein
MRPILELFLWISEDIDPSLQPTLPPAWTVCEGRRAEESLSMFTVVY